MRVSCRSGYFPHCLYTTGNPWSVCNRLFQPICCAFLNNYGSDVSLASWFRFPLIASLAFTVSGLASISGSAFLLNLWSVRRALSCLIGSVIFMCSSLSYGLFHIICSLSCLMESSLFDHICHFDGICPVWWNVYCLIGSDLFHELCPVWCSLPCLIGSVLFDGICPL